MPGCQKFLGLDPDEYCYDTCSKDAEAVTSDKGRELDRRLRDYCSVRTCIEVEKALNEARIGCTRVFNTKDQYHDEHYAAREMTVPVLDRQSGVPIRVYGVVPKMSLTPGRIWRGAPSIGDDTTDILATLLSLSEPEIDKFTMMRWSIAPNRSPSRRSTPSTLDINRTPALSDRPC